MPQQPHDRLFKETFSRPDVARALLEEVLPDDLRMRLDLNALSFATARSWTKTSKSTSPT